MIRLSVTARIALLSIALALVSNLTVLGFVRQQAQADAIAGIRRDTIEESDALAAAYRSGGIAALREAIGDATDAADETLATAIVDRRGIRIAGGGPDRLEVPLGQTRFRVARIAATGDWAAIDSGYAIRPVGRDWLVVARMLAGIEDQQSALERALAIGLVVALVLGIAGGLIVSRYVARRLRLVSDVIAAVGEGDLSRRVPIAAKGDDAFDRLAHRLNAALGRLAAVMGELRVVTDGLAHDLRSPLARLRTRTEQAVLLPEGPAREAALAGLIVETDLVMRMLTTLIEITRSEQVSRDRFTRVDPATLVAEIADLYQPAAEDLGLAFHVAIEGSPAPLRLHRELVSQAIANLVDNALKYGAAGGEITLGVAERDGAVTITVADRGPGIATADRDTALRRFGRLDAARSLPGAGLGMALVDAVARLHGGSFELDDAQPGLIARLVLSL